MVSYQGAFVHQSAYGNVQLNTTHLSIELRNEVQPLIMFSEIEDISVFSCQIKPANSVFMPYCEEPWKTVFVNEKITGLSLVNDTIIVNDNEYAITFDMAVIVTTEKHDYVFSRNWFFSETIDLSIDKSFDDIYPISRVISDWNDDATRMVSVQRKTISL